MIIISYKESLWTNKSRLCDGKAFKRVYLDGIILVDLPVQEDGKS